MNNDIKIKALVDEFCKVKDLFYKFLTEDMESNFVIEKVLFLYNEELELQFANKYQETYTNLQFRTNVELSSDSEDNKKESKWRQRLLTSLGKHSCSTVGNAHSSVNLTLAWHGTSESGIALFRNFLMHMLKINTSFIQRPLALQKVTLVCLLPYHLNS